MHATAETTKKHQQSPRTETKERDQILEKEPDEELNVDSEDALIGKERDDRRVSDANPDLRKETRITVRQEKMADVQYVFPGYAMTPRVYKQESGHKRKYFSSPYRCTTDNVNASISSSINKEGKPSRKSHDKTVQSVSDVRNDNDYAVVMDKQGVQYKTMPGKLMTLPPIEDLKILKRPVLKVKVSVGKKAGKFQPIPVVDDGQDQQLMEPRYRLTKLEQISAPAPKCHKLMVPKALKHPAKMRAVHIPYQRSNNDNTENSKPQEQQGVDDSGPKNTNNSPQTGNRRKSVRFAPDTLGIAREKYAKTPPPKSGHPDDENFNFSNNNGEIQIQLPEIKLEGKTSDKKPSVIKPILTAFPKITTNTDPPESPYKEGVTRRKGSVTQITFLPHSADFSRTPLSSPRVSRPQGQGQRRVRATVTVVPPTWQDHEDFEDYLMQKYPHILNAIRTNPALLDVGKPSASVTNSRTKQRMIQNFYHKPAQTDETPICPDGYYPTDVDYI